MTNPPHQVAGAGGFFQHVGTILYSMVVNPVNGKVYVANTDANNADRFEGPGIFAGHSLRGHLHESRITVLSPGGGVAPRHLNKHINFASCCAPIPNAENARSLALPQGMAVTGDGATLYVAALGSDKVGVLHRSSRTTFVQHPNQIHVTGGGPPASCSMRTAASSTCWPGSTMRSSIINRDPPRPRTSRCTAPGREKSWSAAGSSTTPRS
jgi:hypothetical protein